MERITASTTIEELDQAVMVASSQEISLGKLEAWARREGASDKLRKFKQELATRKRPARRR